MTKPALFALVYNLSILLSALIAVLLASLYSYGRRIRAGNETRKQDVFKNLGLSSEKRYLIVGFFHPYCNAGGGGERVLWTAIASTQRTHPNVVNVVYSGDIDASKEQILDKIKSRFNIVLDPSLLHFVFLNSRYLVEDSMWPRFTLLGQSIGSMYLVWEAMTKLIPDLYIDSMGYALTFPVVSLIGRIPIGAYVHYPTISTDMLARVKSRVRWHTNANDISASPVLSKAKIIYYRLFMYEYAVCLRLASFLMVNSSWTKNHIDSILVHSDPVLDFVHLLPPFLFIKLFLPANPPKAARIVYPPCDTREISSFDLAGRQRVILSVAQFRPEKDHAAQLHAFQVLLKQNPKYKSSGPDGVRLVLIGGSRNSEDANRVEELRGLARKLAIESQVQFIVNAPYQTVLEWLSKASIGLSTMVDEHFGINVVEFMAAGVIPVAHASGGPLLDIVVPFNGKVTGYHAKTPAEFAEALEIVLSLPSEEDIAIRQRARTWAEQQFSERKFEEQWDASGWSSRLPSP